MAKIEWAGRSDWNPIRGCTRASEGCRNCYAEAIAARFSGPGQPFNGFADRTANGPRWTGKVDLIEDHLTLPLKWRKPALIFVNSAFDLFHESIPDEWIDQIFAVMAMSPQHTFQVLTKRTKRMRAYMERLSRTYSVTLANAWIKVSAKLSERQIKAALKSRWPTDGDCLGRQLPWPLQNVWLGASVEDQPRAEERIPDLLAAPAAKHFLSIEPMLGPVDPTSIEIDGDYILNALVPLTEFQVWEDQWSPEATGLDEDEAKAGWIDEFGAWPPSKEPSPRLDWIIAGGETGPNARPSNPNWYRLLRDLCAAVGIPFFFKSWGEWAPSDGSDDPIWRQAQLGDIAVHVFLDDLVQVARIGKRNAGSLLDGHEHKNFPDEMMKFQNEIRSTLI